MIANAYVGPEQKLPPLVRRGDVVRFVPRRGAARYRFVRVTSDIARRAQYSPRAPEWITFLGTPVRCYGDHAAIGPEASYDVRVRDLHRLPRRSVRSATLDGRLRVDVVSIVGAGVWYRVTQRAPGGPVLVAEVGTPDEVAQALRAASLGRVGLADLCEVTP
jgi:hypothetical protein